MNIPIQNPITKAEPNCGFSIARAAARRGAWLFVTLALLAPFAGNVVADSMGTAFGYQGHLNDGTNVANGLYDLQFTLYDALTGGSAVGQPLTNSAVTVSNGVFTVWLDFSTNAPIGGPPAFNGDARWLELRVRTNSGPYFTTLVPRQRAPIMPYALYASKAGDITGALPEMRLSTNVALLYPARTATGWIELRPRLDLGQVSLAYPHITDGGSGYTAPPLVTVNDPTRGVVALVTATVTDGQVASLRFTNALIWPLEAPNSLTLTIGPPQSSAQTFTGTNFFTSANTFLQGVSLSTNWNVSVGSFTDPDGRNHTNTLLFSEQGVVQAGIDPADGFEVLSNLTVTGTLHARNGGDIQHDLQVGGNLTVGGSNGVALPSNWNISVGSYQDPTGANHVSSLLFSKQGVFLAGILPDFGLGIPGNLGVNGYFHCSGQSTVAGESFVFGGLHVGADLQVGGNAIITGTLSAKNLNQPSDRNLKENFSVVSPREVLDKVATLAITRWNFKDDPGTPHFGAMAQDFYAAFNVGPDDKHIATVDADGVALAAIQGLNEKLEEQLKAKDQELQSLRQRLDKLEQLLATQNR